MYRRRKGLSSIIGAAIFVGMLVLAFSSLQFFMRDLSALNDATASMAAYDEERRRENLIIEQIALAQLSSDSSSITGSSIAGATLYPIGNMNFTDNADGWIFSADLYNPETPPNTPVTLTAGNDEDRDGSTSDDKELDTPNNDGILPDGGFAGGRSSAGVPSQSGPGAIFSYFSLISVANNDEGGALLKWTYKFTLDANTAAAINNAASVFSLGYYIPEEDDVKGPAKNDDAIIFYTITVPSGTVFPIEIDEVDDEISWQRKEILASRLRDSSNNPITWAAGDYKLQLTVMVDLKGDDTDGDQVSRLKVYFDDVGIKLNLLSASAQSIQLNSYDLIPAKFTVTSPDTINTLDFSIQGSSSVSAKQYVFLYDFAQSEWALVLSSSVSSTTSNLKLMMQSMDVPRFVAQVAGSYTVDPGVTKNAVVGNVWVRILVSAVTASSFTYSGTLSLDTQMAQDNTVSFVVSNTGGITAHIVRYWIITGAETKSVDVDTYLDPGKSTTLSQGIVPTSGEIEIRTITDRGSIASLRETV
jgi:hypothetical protein